MNYEQWWRIVQVLDREGNLKDRYPFLMQENVYAFGLHLEHLTTETVRLRWEICKNYDDHVGWNYFHTSELEKIEETDGSLLVHTRNSVYHFVPVAPPELPDVETEMAWLEAHLEANPVFEHTELPSALRH